MRYVHTFVGLITIAVVSIAYGLSGHTSRADSQTEESATSSSSGRPAMIVVRDAEGHLKPYDNTAASFEIDIAEEVVEISEENSASETEEKLLLAVEKEEKHQVATGQVHQMPFFSQFADISDSSWQKIGCGIASLAMIIEYYEPGEITVDGLLRQGIDAGAYLQNAGWIHQGLINLSKQYGLSGHTKDLSGSSNADALKALVKATEESPVIASVHYTFEPTNPIPHLVVIRGVKGDTVYYNDPAEPGGNGSISAEKFLKAWKKRYIAIYPNV